MAYGDNYGEYAYRIGEEKEPEFLLDVQEKLMASRFAENMDISKHEGTSIEIQRLLNLDVVKDEIEGTSNPDGFTFKQELINMSIKRYGAWMPTDKHVILTSDDKVLEKTMKSASTQVGRSIESLDMDVFKSGAKAIHSNGTSRVEVDQPIRTGMLDLASRHLEGNEAMTFSSLAYSTPSWGSIAMDGCFMAFAHHDLTPDFRALPSNKFTRVENYPNSVTAFPNEIGRYGRIRVIASAFMTPWLGAGATNGGTTYKSTDVSGTEKFDVYPVVIFGEESVCVGGLQGENSTKLIIHNPTPDSVDKLGLEGHVGWLTWRGGTIKQDKHIIRLEVTARTDSALSVVAS